MDRDKQTKIIEALILACPEPLTPGRIGQIVAKCTPAVIRECVDALNRAYEAEGRSFEIWEVAGGYQFRTRPDYASYVQALQQQRPSRLSRAALETLSIVAYRQPLTRAEIEHIRGVDAGPVLRNLVERHLVKISGHKEVPGRPMLYATTPRFLELFGLTNLEDLPTLREIDELVGGAEENDLDAEKPAGLPVESVEESASPPNGDASP